MNAKQAKYWRRYVRSCPALESGPMVQYPDGSLRYPLRSPERLYRDLKRRAASHQQM